MSSRRHILVIGAGASGLAAIKSCKEEFLDVTCYEKSEHFGGRWRYREVSTPGLSSVMKSTVCISSKEMEAFSDFPPPNDFPTYLHHTKMLEYLILYAEKFDLTRNIKYQMEVVRVRPSLEYENNGKWSVTTLNKCSNTEIEEEFDGIMVCTGLLSESTLPNFPGQNSFNGFKLHSQFLKTTTSFENLKILIVGNGNSAIDAAIDMSTVAEQVYLSTESGFWLFPKMGPKGLPFDMHLQRRDIHFLRNISSDIVNSYVEKFLETRINHDEFGIKPLHRAMDKPPSVNEELPDKILTGRVIIKGSISTFKENGVIFEHEDSVTELDGVVFATGYEMKLPFIGQEIYSNNKGSFNLYKHVFPARLNHPTLAFIGFTKSNGPRIPVSESQSRWASRVFSTKVHLPPNDVMNSNINSKSSKTKNANKITVDYIEYMEELAEEYGVKPNMNTLFFKDSRLFWACLRGPFLSYQYRLVGPNKLNNARDLILGCEQRVKNSLKSKMLTKIDKHERA